MEKYIQTTVQESEKLAKRLARVIKGGETFALIGPLGAGKTTFTQHLAKALGVKSKITSPTFVLMQTYEGKKFKDSGPLFIHHLDLYRLAGAKEIMESGLTEYWGNPDSVTLIEWADKAVELLPKHTTTINFSPL